MSNTVQFIKQFLNTPIDANVIKQFAQGLYDNFDLAFHFDDDFSDYVNNETGQPLFNSQEAAALDKILGRMWDWCKANNIDIHELAGDVQQAEFKKRSILPNDPEEIDGIEECDEYELPENNNKFRKYDDISKENFYTEFKQFKQNKSLMESINGGYNIIDYLNVAREALKAGKIKDIMDSPIVSPKGYEDDKYFTILHNNGKYDMVQELNGKIIIDRDVNGDMHTEKPEILSIDKLKKYLMSNKKRSSEIGRTDIRNGLMESINGGDKDSLKEYDEVEKEDPKQQVKRIIAYSKNIISKSVIILKSNNKEIMRYLDQIEKKLESNNQLVNALVAFNEKNK